MKKVIDPIELAEEIDKYCGDYYKHGDDAYDKTAVRIAIGLAPGVEVIDPTIIDTLEKMYEDANVSKFTSVACCAGYRQGIRDCINVLKGVDLGR